MITLSKKLKESQEKGKGQTNATNSTKSNSSRIRDHLLIKELSDIGSYNNSTCQIKFPDPNILHHFTVSVTPEDGMWKDGCFKFNVSIPEEYNMKPPVVKCATSVWHPNISLKGEVCLSILREHSLDGSGWAPTRSVKDLIWGLGSLFTDLADFDDPLNLEAANEFKKDPRKFRRTLEVYLYKNAPT
ncbi:NEDD8-conjugating enzyme UBE2F-like [Ciona intestinalis]